MTTIADAGARPRGPGRLEAVRAASWRSTDVSVELRPGEVHALVGENGAGKSTLIKVLTGVYQPDEGTIDYRGEPVTFARPRDAQAAGISTIYQEVNLVPLLSVARNLFLGREPTTRLGLIDFGRMRREASASLARYGIAVDVRRPLSELGLGVQQMVAIARAIDADHRVVIMDEPTSSLEPREVERLIEVVGLLRRDGVAVVYVSHRLDEVFRLCDVVTVLRDGRRVHTGPIAQITRLELVSKMLGRELSEVARARTRFGSHEASQDARALLRATGLTRRHVLDGVTVEARAGEVVGLAGLLGSGRTETAKAIFGAQPLDDGAVEVAGEAVKAGSPRPLSRPASRSSRRTARPRGSSRRCPCARTSCSRPCRPSREPGSSRSAGRTRSSRRSSAACGSRRRVPTSGSASCPAATSRRSCSPACCASSHGCCSSTIRRAASTSAPRPRSRADQRSGRSGAGGRSDLL